MARKFFVDTNILVYAHDPLAGAKHDRARELMEQLWLAGEGAVSTQVLQELVVSLRRKVADPYTAEEMRALLMDLLGWHVVVNTPQSVLRALEIEERYRISFWDAMILQAAELAGAEVVYSEDLSAGQRYGDVRVVNPLVGALE
jgi:predicted nucleic acid-binding protein